MPWPASPSGCRAHCIATGTAARQARALATLAELSDSTLRDIGAPEWLRAEADARRDADRQRLVEMNLGMPRHG
jgi:uncharacterized protein YjiS (DUF1127 family)